MNGKELAELLEKVAEKAAKQTAREILQPLYNRIRNHYGNRTTLTSNDVKEFAEKYGIDLEEQ